MQYSATVIAVFTCNQFKYIIFHKMHIEKDPNKTRNKTINVSLFPTKNYELLKPIAYDLSAQNDEKKKGKVLYMKHRIIPPDST